MRTALRKILCEWRLCLLTFGPPWWGLTKFDVPLVYISNSNFYYNNSFKWILAQSLNEILLKNLQGAHITTQISSHAVIVHSVVLIFRFRRFFRASESCLLVSYKETVWFCFWKFFWIFTFLYISLHWLLSFQIFYANCGNGITCCAATIIVLSGSLFSFRDIYQ